MAINASILAIITTIGQAIVAVFSFLLAVHKTKNDKDAKRKDDIEESEKQLDKICDNGTISELIDATKDLGKSKK